MSVWASFRLSTPGARGNACRAILDVPDDHIVEIRQATRNLDQNAAAHAALTDIAKQVQWHGKKFNVLTWKRLTMAAFLRELGEQPELIPALDNKGFDIVFEKTSQLSVKKCSAWLEWIYAWGAQNGVVFRDRKRQ